MPRSRRTADRSAAAERLMNLSEAAQFLHIDPDTLRTLTRNGRVPAMKIGRQWRFDPELLREWVRERSLHSLACSQAGRVEEPFATSGGR